MAMNYVMTLSGPKQTRVGLLGVFDPVVSHPLALVVGLAAGVVLAAMKKRR